MTDTAGQSPAEGEAARLAGLLANADVLNRGDTANWCLACWGCDARQDVRCQREARFRRATPAARCRLAAADLFRRGWRDRAGTLCPACAATYQRDAPDAPFLDTIWAAPDDDIPRLAFADRLAERGEPARAEFIRVQCAVVRATGRPAAALRAREAELLAETAGA